MLSRCFRFSGRSPPLALSSPLILQSYLNSCTPHVLGRPLLQRIQSFSQSVSCHKESSEAAVGLPAVPGLVYQWYEGVEPLEEYRPGGYHPTHLGDRYSDGRYEIVHKLGYGGFSTVWLARDHHENRYVALKILVANAFEKSNEARNLHILNSGDSAHPGKHYIPTLLDEFVINGPNGQHLCLVSEPVGCSVAQTKDVNCFRRKFPVNVARSICAQSLLGLDYIHSCGLVHGDLHLNNVLFRSLDAHENYTVRQLYQMLGEPEKIKIDGLAKCPTAERPPKYCLWPAVEPQPSADVLDAQVIIADFGHASLQNEEVKRKRRSILSPPETFFDEPLGPAVDIWTLGCNFYEILGENPLFFSLFGDQNEVIAEMMSTLGPFPKRWWNSWEKRGDYYSENGSRLEKSHCTRPPRSLNERLRTMGRGEDPVTCEFSQEEVASIENLLRSMLTYEPSERSTAKDALQSEWMMRWALPALKQVCKE
ncbi:hypothetical protein PRK78_003627 [Emydomyces testavorans]|uniref:non-specific serine/threonine protein kinase n=1 Tax=Emydomyces testavorans TaxID=2070801 RepID=A0AAF0DH87_9EURO|nr:hypothetical protein PRK78_003627 [Emydomyces testavorans]